jgi:serine/threonine protein kinase
MNLIHISKYKIHRLIGEGGMATVYEAEHEVLGLKVAIKVLKPELSSNDQIRNRFKNEAKMMASLDHPNILKVIDFDEQVNQLSFIMELLDGEDLNQKIKKNGPLSDNQIEDIFSQSLSAFQHAHDKGVVHRDIKPSNIFITKSGQVKILDFGISKLISTGKDLTMTGTQMGTPVYMSPEQVKADKTIDHRSDIYSLGVTMYAAVQGKSPYNSEVESQFEIYNKIVFESLPLLGKHSRFNALITKACAKDREKRFQSCTEWLSEMRRLDSSERSQSTFQSENFSNDKTVLETVEKTVVNSSVENEVSSQSLSELSMNSNHNDEDTSRNDTKGQKNKETACNKVIDSKHQKQKRTIKLVSIWTFVISVLIVGTIFLLDLDRDGFYIWEDNCDTTYGSWYGCPDSDGDGFEDYLDDCPYEPSTGISFNGCPDSDGDGFDEYKERNYADTTGMY